MSVAIETTAFEVHLPRPPVPSKGDREQLAFLRLLPGLLNSHLGKFVAIHNEQVVDSDLDDIALVQRVHERVGYVPIHVAKVMAQAAAERIPGPRESRPSE